MDRMTHFHRYVGFIAAVLMASHVVSITIGYARDSSISIWDQIVDSALNYPYVANAMIGFSLFMLVAISSVRWARKRLSYEHWWLVHLGSYLAVALTVGHQTAVGTDFVRDGWAFAYWVVLYVAVALMVLGYRWVTPLLMVFRHRFAVVSVEVEGPGVVTVVVGGRDFGRLAAQAGQFFVLRSLTQRSWWKGHPFSVSAPPDGTTLRFTIKALGDDTTELQTIPVGTRVSIEGPYGGFLPFRSSERKTLYIAGGVGITPFRGLIDDIDRPDNVALLYRSRSPKEAVFLDELVALSSERGFDLRLSYSAAMNGDRDVDPFHPEQLLRFLPDLSQREVFVVGSQSMISSARRGLRGAGVPAGQIHYESFTL
jgi:predicted ferric reductase